MVTGDTIHVYIQVYQTLLIFFYANKQYSICHHFSYVAQRASVVSCYIMNGVNMYAEARVLIQFTNTGCYPINLITLTMITHWKRFVHLGDSVLTLSKSSFSRLDMLNIT